MKPKSNNPSVFKGLLGASALTAVFLAFSTVLKGAPESEGLSQRKSNFRNVVQVIVKNRLNFQSETRLSEDQKTRIRAVLQNNQDEILLLKEKGLAARRSFQETNKDGFISPLAHVSADDIGKIASSRALLMAKIRSEVLPILTPEQQAYARQALAEVRNTIDRDTENIN